jgi:hypothetical protein
MVPKQLRLSRRPLTQKFSHPCFKQLHQFLLHVRIVIRNIEADHALAVEVFPELLRHFAAMGFFHDEDDVGPVDLFWPQGCFGIVVGACGIGFHVWPFGEDGLCRGAAQFVLAANEKGVGHVSIISQSGTGGVG